MSASTRRPFAAASRSIQSNGQFAIVLTDDEDDGTTMMSTESSDDESTIFRRPEVSSSSSSSVVTCQRMLSDDVTRLGSKVFAPSLNGTSRQAPAGEPKLLPFDGDSDDDDVSNWRCRCPADAVNRAAVLAVVLLSYAAFPLHVPDIAVPPQTTLSQVRPRSDAMLQAVVIGALVGSVLLAPSVDVRGARRNVGRTLFTGSSCVVLFAFLRCIPGVPVPIMCLCASAAGAGLVIIQLAALHTLTGNDSGGEISSLSWYSLPSVVQRNFVVSGLVTAAVVGGPLLSAILRLILTAPQISDVVSSSVESHAASAEWRSSDATTAAAFSNFSYQQQSLMVEFGSSTNMTASNAAEAGSTVTHVVWTTVSRPEVVSTSRHLAFVLCLLLCSLGALPISMFAVDDRSDVGTKAKRKNYDDVDEGQSFSLKAIARRLIRAYGHREVVLLAVTSTFFGLLRMFSYFAFVRYYAPVGPSSILVAIVLLTVVSATVAVAVGFALLHVGRIKLLLPVAVALLPLLVMLLLDRTWTRYPAFYYSIAGSLAAIDGCMSVVCTAFLTLVPSLNERRSVHGLSTACHSIGQLVAFAIYANIDTAVPDDDFAAGGSSWTPGRIITAFVMTSLVIATLCYLAAEISYRLAVAERGSPGLIGSHPPVPVAAALARIRHQGRVTWASSPSDGVCPVDDPSTRKFPYRYMAVARRSKDRSDREGNGGASNGNQAFHKSNSDAVKLQWMNGSRQLGDGGEQVDENRPADDENLSAQSQRQQQLLLQQQFDDEQVIVFDETETGGLIDLEQ